MVFATPCRMGLEKKRALLAPSWDTNARFLLESCVHLVVAGLLAHHHHGNGECGHSSWGV